EKREELIALSRRFVSTMFGVPTLAAAKKFWVEKTPANLIAMDLIWELFPEATIIHIKRDPRGVFFSFTQQDWLPQGMQQSARFLGHIYWRWMNAKRELDFEGKRYIELRLEDLVHQPREALSSIAKVAGITDAFSTANMKPPLVDRWRTEMPLADQR